jgi:hypothetical protein
MRVIAVNETSVQKMNADVGNVQHLQYLGEDIVALIGFLGDEHLPWFPS